MDKDADGEPCLALTEFEEGGLLLRRLDAFMKKASPNQEIIDEIEHHATNKVLKETVDQIVRTWSAPTVGVEARTSLQDHKSLMGDKLSFLAAVYTKMLYYDNWKSLNMSVYRAFNNLFLAVIDVAGKFPYCQKEFLATVLHFQVKQFISQFSESLMVKIITDDYDYEVMGRRPLPAIPTDLLVPTMRRLGCLDCLNPDWNFFGAWDEICLQINKRADEPIVVKIRVDKILQGKSMALKLARNSLSCRRFYGFNRDFPPQCFRYYSKCSVMSCCNMETPENPHARRCEKCWYFHFCSVSCERYAKMFGLHDCEQTPPEKAQQIKKETEAYLGWNKKKDDGAAKHEMCNFCHTREENLPTKLLKCSRCKVVAYCNRNCQAWDWSDHKQVCK